VTPTTGKAPATGVLLAGRRPGVDPLADHFKVADKALIEVAGEAMLSRVARTLLGHPGIGSIIILAQEAEVLAAQPPLAWMKDEPRIAFDEAGTSIARTVSAVMTRYRLPLLITTADNPLLDHAILTAFIAGSTEADLAAAVVEREVLLTAYPGSRRTWLPFRGGAYSGANLFWIASDEVLPVLSVWSRVEQKRKRRRAVLAAFGPLILAGIALRLLTVGQAAARVGRRFGVRARAVILPQAEACIDVDKPADHALVESIIRHRESSALS